MVKWKEEEEAEEKAEKWSHLKKCRDVPFKDHSLWDALKKESFERGSVEKQFRAIQRVPRGTPRLFSE